MKRILYTGLLLPAISLVISACGNSSESAESTAADAIPNSTSVATPTAPLVANPEVNWLDKNSIIVAAPSVEEGMTTTPLGNAFPRLKIDTCQLIDKIDFYGDDSFSLRRNDVPDGLRKFALVKSSIGDFIMFPDGSFVGGYGNTNEILMTNIKGFPESMNFAEEAYKSFDFVQLPELVVDGYLNVQTWKIDHPRDTDENSTIYYDEVGNHTLIILGASGKISSYMPGTNIPRHLFLPDLRYAYFHDTRYISNEDDYNNWIGVCTTTLNVE
jgi:hypothetical protein